MRYTAGRRLFEKENLHMELDDLICLFRPYDIRKMDPERDRLLLAWLARCGFGIQRRAALLRLGRDEAPEADTEDPDAELAQILEEQVRQLDGLASFRLLREAAFDSDDIASTAAFCRLTGSELMVYCRGPAGFWVFSSCGRMSCLEDADVAEFCREMAEKNGPFANVAKQVLTVLGTDPEP